MDSVIRDHSSFYGLYMAGASSLTLTGNTFSDNSYGATKLDFGEGLAFTHSGNIASSGAKRGFVVDGSIVRSQT